MCDFLLDLKIEMRQSDAICVKCVKKWWLYIPKVLSTYTSIIPIIYLVAARNLSEDVLKHFTLRQMPAYWLICVLISNYHVVLKATRGLKAYSISYFFGSKTLLASFLKGMKLLLAFFASRLIEVGWDTQNELRNIKVRWFRRESFGSL